MGVYDTLKDLVGLIPKVDNIELYRKLNDLQTQVNALVEENRSLKEKAAIQEQLAFRRNSYWRGDEGPFCTRCWDAESKLIRLHLTQEFPPRCPKCNWLAEDPDSSQHFTIA